MWRPQKTTTGIGSSAAIAAAMLIVSAACGTGSRGGSPTEGSTGLDAARERGSLVVANTQANPPWNFLDDKNEPAGFDVDVAKELATRLGIEKVEFVAASFETFIPGVQSGRYDIVIAGQTITEERKKEVGFSVPYQVNGVSIFVADGNTSISSVADLRGKTITVTGGTTQEQWVRDNVPSATVKTLQNATLSLTDVAQGRADATLVSKFQGVYLAANAGLEVKPVGDLLNSEVNGMSFKKNDEAMKTAVDKAIEEMIADGTLTRISAKWLDGLDMAAELDALPQE